MVVCSRHVYPTRCRGRLHARRMRADATARSRVSCFSALPFSYMMFPTRHRFTARISRLGATILSMVHARQQRVTPRWCSWISGCTTVSYVSLGISGAVQRCCGLLWARQQQVIPLMHELLFQALVRKCTTRQASTSNRSYRILSEFVLVALGQQFGGQHVDNGGGYRQ